MVRLNAAQQRIVNELDRNILLLASAGTGKTNTLAYRVAHIIESGRAAGEEILCMTFTNKACREMKERIAGKVGPKAKAVEVSTFHSFCYALLAEESKRQDDLFTDITIYDEEDCKELLAPLKPAGMKDIEFQNLVAWVKEARSRYGLYSDSSTEDYKRTIRRAYAEEKQTMLRLLGGADSFIMGDVQRRFEYDGYRIMVAYEEALQQVHGVDFTDLITRVHRLFQNEDVRRRWQQRYKYIAIDEMQDTSTLECEVMKVLWQGNHVLLCGDYFQTIYEWRGSDPLALLKAYRDEFSPMTVVFYENYRANQTLFKASLAVLQAMFPDIIDDFYEETPYAVTGDAGTPITIHGAPTEWKEGAYIFDAIRSLPKDSNVGILVRNNKRAQYLSRLFANLNVHLPPEEQREFMIIDEFKFFRRQEIKDIMAYFKLLLNSHDSVSAKRISKRYVKGIGEARIQAIESADTRKAGLTLTDFFDMAIFEGEPYQRLLEGLNAGKVVVFDVESTGTDTMTDEIIQIAAIRLGTDGSETECFERFICPEKSVGDSQAVHGFSDEWLKEHGEPAEAVLADFVEFAKDAVIVGHNVGYDISILGSELHRHHLPQPRFSAVYDTLDIYRRFYPNLLNHKLGFLSEYFPIDHKPTHNALDDIRATALLLLYAVKENIEPTADRRRALIGSYKNAFATIASQMATLRRKSNSERPTQLLAYIMNDMGVLQYYKQAREEQRVEYIRDLYRMMEQLEQEESELSGPDCLRRILQQAALTAGEPDQRIKNETRIPIITVHQAKGSEFDYVFLANMNVGVFPGMLAIREGKEEEEKRLFYVALTRAKKQLTISYITTNHRGAPWSESPFLAYLPKELVERK